MFQEEGPGACFWAEMSQPVSLIYALCTVPSDTWDSETWFDPTRLL